MSSTFITGPSAPVPPPPPPPLAPPLPEASPSVILSLGLSGKSWNKMIYFRYAFLRMCFSTFSSIAGGRRKNNTFISFTAIRIKKPIKTKFRLPVFNWTALKPNQIKGTVFNEIDDERVLEVNRWNIFHSELLFIFFLFFVFCLTVKQLMESNNSPINITFWSRLYSVLIGARKEKKINGAFEITVNCLNSC